MNSGNKCPCMGCQRVDVPAACDNKDCMLWRRWFIHRWDRLRARYTFPKTGGQGGGCL